MLILLPRQLQCQAQPCSQNSIPCELQRNKISSTEIGAGKTQGGGGGRCFKAALKHWDCKKPPKNSAPLSLGVAGELLQTHPEAKPNTRCGFPAGNSQSAAGLQGSKAVPANWRMGHARHFRFMSKPRQRSFITHFKPATKGLLEIPHTESTLTLFRTSTQAK